MRDPRRGGALLAVLWLSAALTAISFALSRGVRTEFDRAALNVDSTKAYFLAQGAVEGALRRLDRPRDSENPDFEFVSGQRRMRFEFPSGAVDVEIVSESGKLDVNRADPEALLGLLVASGLDPQQARETTTAIVQYRERLRARQISYGLTAEQMVSEFGIFEDGSTFSPRETSIQELEELLTIPGVTAETLYGGYREDGEGRLQRTAGLIDNLTTRGTTGVNVNYASREMLLAAGLAENFVDRLIEQRLAGPLERQGSGIDTLTGLNGPVRLGFGGESSALTIRAEAELADGRARRTVLAVVERNEDQFGAPWRISRWYDAAW